MEPVFLPKPAFPRPDAQFAAAPPPPPPPPPHHSFVSTTVTVTEVGAAAEESSSSAARPFDFLFQSLCKLWYNHVAFSPPEAITIDSSNCCEACCGETRSVLAPFDVTSFAVTSLVRCLFCRSSALSLRSATPDDATVVLPYGSQEAVLDALQHTLRAPRGESDGHPVRTFSRGGGINCHTLKDCTRRHTEWQFGPGSLVLVTVDETSAVLPCCFSKAAAGGTLLERVRTSQAYSPVGACACKQTPSGRCSCDEFVTLGLSDATSLYGGADRGDARMILEELGLRRRETALGGSGPQESTAFVLRGSDLFDCCGSECELKVSTERLTLVKHTQSPLLRGLSCWLCDGLCEETLLLEDVVAVTSSKPTPCELAGSVLARLGWSLRKLLGALEVSASPLGIVSGLLLLALAAAIVIYFLDFEVLSLLQATTGWAGPNAALAQIPVVGSLDEVMIIVTAAALLLFVVLVRGVDPLVLLGLTVASAMDSVLFILTVLASPIGLFPCCLRTYVTVRGAYGNAVFRLRPKVDLQMDAVEVASHLAKIIENLKLSRRATASSYARSSAAAITGEVKAPAQQQHYSPQPQPQQLSPQQPPSSASGFARAAAAAIGDTRLPIVQPASAPFELPGTASGASTAVPNPLNAVTGSRRF